MKKTASLLATLIIAFSFLGITTHDMDSHATETTTQHEITKKDNSPSDAVIVITVISIFTVTFAASSILTYKAMRKKSVKNQSQ